LNLPDSDSRWSGLTGREKISWDGFPGLRPGLSQGVAFSPGDNLENNPPPVTVVPYLSRRTFPLLKAQVL